MSVHWFFVLTLGFCIIGRIGCAEVLRLAQFPYSFESVFAASGSDGDFELCILYKLSVLYSPRKDGVSDIFGLDFATVVADGLKNLLDLSQETVVKDRLGEFDDTEVTGTNIVVLFTGGTLEVAIDGT